MEQKNQVGQTLPNGYTVIANYKNRYILAHHSKAGVAEPFAIWNVDQDGNTYSGSYFGKQEDAEKYFTYCCFSWLEANTCTPKCFEEKESDKPNTSDQDIKKLLYQQMQLLAEESNGIDNDLSEKSIAMLKIAQFLSPIQNIETTTTKSFEFEYEKFKEVMAKEFDRILMSKLSPPSEIKECIDQMTKKTRFLSDPEHDSYKPPNKRAEREAFRKNENQLDSPFAIDPVRNDGSPMNDDSYYEEIINGQRKAINTNELMIANTTKNAGMSLAYIGTSHPAFEVVFKHFVNQDYPDLKKRLLQPWTSYSSDSIAETQKKLAQDTQNN